jgi:centromere protein C
LQPLPQESDEGSEQGAEYDEVNDFVEESMAMLNGGDEDGDPQAAANEDEEVEEEISMVDEGDPDPPAPKARGRPPKQSEISAKPAKPSKKPARQVVEEEGSEDAQSSADEDEEIPATAQHKPGPNGRSRPPKAGKASAAEQPQARGSKKRRSLDEEETAAAREPSPEPQPKRQRTEPATAKSKKPTTHNKPPEPAPKKDAAPASASASNNKPAPSAKPKGPGRKRKSSTDADAVVAAARRPPLPKSRGLLINRREAPGDSSSSMFRTRSGRTSFKPLAYWRNERVDYEKDEAEDVVDSSRARNRSRFVLPSIKEVVRVDEPEVEVRSRKPSSRSKGGKGKGKGKRRRGSYGYDDEDDDDDEPADLWELDPGTVTGEVVVWQPEYEFRPPAPNDLVSVMDKQLAISGRAIKTTEVVGGEFRYAKVFSEGFIGAGVVDLPPGAIKRLKNSRKVFMIFFVHVGRVLVTVQETSFRIGKGGIFIVPRCEWIILSYFPLETSQTKNCRQRVHNRE